MRPAHTSQSKANALREWPRVTIPAATAANRIKENGEWKKPRCEKRLSYGMLKARIAMKSQEPPQAGLRRGESAIPAELRSARGT